MTIIIIIAAASIPAFRGFREEQLAREPVQELVRMAKEARIRAMREKRPYQVAFHGTGFTASRYFNPYLQLADLNLLAAEAETGVSRLNPNSDDNEADLDSGASAIPKTQLPLAPPAAKQDDNWTMRYVLPLGTNYSIRFWHDVEDIQIEGEVVKLWVFQPTGICQPLKIHLQRTGAIFDVEFGALTADIVKEAISVP